MSSIVSILLFGAVYLVVYVVKSLGSAPGDDGGKPFGESFPSIEILEPERVDPVPAPLQTVVAPKSPVHKPEPQRQSVHSSVQVVAPSVSENKSPNPGLTNKESSFLPATGRKERLVKLGSKSEAKRAFLYSEIFNRKY